MSKYQVHALMRTYLHPYPGRYPYEGADTSLHRLFDLLHPLCPPHLHLNSPLPSPLPLIHLFIHPLNNPLHPFQETGEQTKGFHPLFFSTITLPGFLLSLHPSLPAHPSNARKRRNQCRAGGNKKQETGYKGNKKNYTVR